MVDINSVYIVVTYEDCVGIKLRFFTENDKAEAYKKESLSIPRDFFASYSVLEKGISVYPDDTWETVKERGCRILGGEYDRKQWEKWCSEQEEKE